MMGSKSKDKRPIVDDDCDGTQIKRKCTNSSIPNSIGRTWINYFHSEAQQLKEVDSTTKVDMQVRREIAGRWYDLSPEEKSQYRSPNECVMEDMVEVREDVAVVDPKTSFMTRCSPEQFSAVISTFTEEQNQVVEELGFGSLLTMKCGRLRRELCAWLVDQFDPLTLSVDLHGVKFNLSPIIFTNIMGIRDGGVIVQLSGSADGVMEMRTKFCTTSPGIPMTDIAEYLHESSNTDEEFKIRFTLFALDTLLCPSSGPYLTPSFLYQLEDVNTIHTKNWATWSFNCLVDGILKFKQSKQQFVSGCVLFLQLFYFNCVAFKQPSVNKSLLPISAWKERDIRKFMRLLLRHGGIGSPTVPVQQSQGIVAAMSSEVKVVQNEKQLDDGVHDIMIIKRDIKLIKEGVSSVCAMFDSSEVVIRRDLKLIKETLSSMCSKIDGLEASMMEEEQDISTTHLKVLCDRPFGEGRETLSRPSVSKRCQSSNSKNNPSFICKICTETKTVNESFSIQGCSHVYCVDCMIKYVASKLQDNITSISCPMAECGGLLEPEYCRNILPVEVFDRWGNALCEAVIPGEHKLYCPFKDCSALLIDDSGEAIRESVCPNCNRIFCAQCKVPWHAGIECEEFQKLNKDGREHEDIMLMKLARTKNWTRCPDCRYYVEKKDGCMYMKCRCGCAFCYNCGDHATPTTHLCHSSPE